MGRAAAQVISLSELLRLKTEASAAGGARLATCGGARASACRTEGPLARPLKGTPRFLWEKDVFIHSVPITVKSPTGKRPQFCFYTGETNSIPQLQEARAEFRVARNLRDPERRNWGEMHMFKNFDSGSSGIFAKTCHRVRARRPARRPTPQLWPGRARSLFRSYVSRGTCMARGDNLVFTLTVTHNLMRRGKGQGRRTHGPRRGACDTEEAAMLRPC